MAVEEVRTGLYGCLKYARLKEPDSNDYRPFKRWPPLQTPLEFPAPLNLAALILNEEPEAFADFHADIIHYLRHANARLSVRPIFAKR